MSGNIWMVSDMLDDEDIEFAKRDYITFYQGADYYGLGLKVFTKMARAAGATYKIADKKVLVKRTTFEAYLRATYRQKQAAHQNKAKEQKKQGVLIVDEESGRINIRFGINDYYGFVTIGTKLDVLVDGEWKHSRLQMQDGWILTDIQTDQLNGLIVKI